jgi:upstream-binding transcription factor
VKTPLKYFFIIRSAAGYYVMTHHSKLGNLTPAEIDALWGTVSEKEKKKCIEEHKKVHKDFVREIEIFIRVNSSVPFLY